jgi:MFS superfamily sulfate permease-like transporter
VVFLIGIELIAVKGMRRILKLRPDEFVVAAITAAVVVVVGVEQAILLAIVLSIVDHLRRSYRPNDTVMEPGPGVMWRSVPVAAGKEAEPGLVVYRFAASLYYANANRFDEEIRSLAGADPRPAWICVDASTIGDVDYTGGDTLKGVHDEIKELGVKLVVALASDSVRAELDRYGVTELIGEDAYFDSLSEMRDAFGAAAPARPVSA